MQISYRETVRMATDAVWSHRFRSGLTILGIVIGITTVVSVSSLLTGLRKNINTFFEEFGPDNIFISKTTQGPNGGSFKERKRRPMEIEYADMLKRFCPSVQEAGVSLWIPPFATGTAPMTAKVKGFETENVNIIGQSAENFTMSPREMAAGRVFTPDEAQRGDHVAVLGNNVAKALFPGNNAVGQTYLMGGAEYLIVGVFAPAKGGFFGENPIDNQAVIPLKTAHLRYPQLDRYQITAQARPGLRNQAYDEVEAALRRIRHVRRQDPDDFSMSTADQIIKQFDSLTGMIVLISIAISGLGLLVGGIGVMNIMLVSVTERTREIGVRKALGARRFDIIFQFLMEAITLTGSGGVLGVLFSVGVTLLISAIFPALPAQVPLWAVVTGFTVSVAVGLFFGVWPAFKAARLDPVEALRYE